MIFNKLDDDEVHFGKRSSEIGMDCNFFNWQTAVAPHIDGYKKLINEVKNIYEVELVSIHGELFGGSYKHPDVSPVTNASLVQKGIKYCPDNKVIIFDIRLRKHFNSPFEFLPHDMVIELCNKYNLLVVPILYSGNLMDCLKWSNEHNTDITEIPTLFGLPPLENNTREGHVIKPLKSLFYGNSERIIFKDKNDKFKEREKTEHREKPEQPTFSFKLNDCIDEVYGLVNKNRFNSVTSKIGEFSIRDFQQIMLAFRNDIIEEFQRDPELSCKYNNLDFSEQSILMNVTLKEVQKFMGANKAELF